MAKFDRLTVLNTIIESGLVPIFYHDDLEVVKRVVDAVAAGGARVLEFTNRGDRAWHRFTELIEYCDQAHPDLILGAGSIADAPTAALYVASGANFIVGPIFNPAVARLCNRRKIAYAPGCGTVSEISTAESYGVEIVKIFPGGQIGGPAFVKAVRGPMPWTRFMPTGGVAASEESLRGWFEAGACCVGMGGKLIRKEWLAAGDYDAITENVRQVLAWIEAIG